MNHQYSANITEPANTGAVTPCLAHGGDRVFSRSCWDCPAWAIGCFPARPRQWTREEIIAAMDEADDGAEA